jgi:hypothetical protein
MGVDGNDLLDNLTDHSLDCFCFPHTQQRRVLEQELRRLRQRYEKVRSNPRLFFSLFL